MDIFNQFLETTGFANLTVGNLAMIVIGLVFIALAIIKDYEPLLLVPIGFGILIGNIPTVATMSLGVYDQGGFELIDGELTYEAGSVLSYIYFGVSQGIFPPLIFLGIGAMTDFSTMLSNPKLVLLGAAAQMGIFLTLLVRCIWALRPKKRGRSASSAAPTGRRPSSWPPSWRPHLLGPDRHRGLFLHGPGAGDPAADHEAADHPRGTADPHEAAPPRQPPREDHLSRSPRFSSAR